MYWLDVAGAPGSGKSTLCDPLWGPHDIDFSGVTEVDPDWLPFVEVCGELLNEVKDHPTIEAMVRMLRRSLRKISVVKCMYGLNPEDVYIQTALVQRGLGFGWRLLDLGKVEKVRKYFEVMPVSLGAVMTSCPTEIVEQRNRDRRLVRETSHEDRHWMVEKMQPAIKIAVEVLGERNIDVLEISTNQPIEKARHQLVSYATTLARNAEAIRSGRKVEVLQTPSEPGRPTV